MAEITVSVGEAIRDRRQLIGLSQEALAAICEINRGYLGQVERGEVSVTVTVLAKIASGLNTSLSELLGGIGDFRPGQ